MRLARCGVLVLVVCALLVLPAQAGGQAAQTRFLYFGFPRGQPTWLLPVRAVLVEGASPYRDVLDAVCRGPQTNGVVGPLLPRGTRVERLSVAEGTAVVDLDLGRAGCDGHLAALAVQAIAHSLSQFGDVEKVEVRVDGRPWPDKPVQAREPHRKGTAPETEEESGEVSPAVAPDSSVVFAGFPDLEGAPADGAVLALALRGVFAGYPDGTFRPQLPVSRAEAVKSLVEVLSGRALPLRTAADPLESGWFSDAGQGHWVFPHLMEAVRRGVLGQPHDQEEFLPGAPLDGATLVRWLYQVVRPQVPGAGSREGNRQGPVSVEEAADWLVSQGILAGEASNWLPRTEISRGDWALVLASALRLGGPDLYLVSPGLQESLQGEVLIAGVARWPNGQVTVAVLDARGRELAARAAAVSTGAGAAGWGWFAEWLHFPRPLTSSAGIVQVKHLPPEGREAQAILLRVPVFIR